MSQESNLLDDRVKKIVDDYLKGNHDHDVPVKTHHPPDQLRSRLDLSLPEEGCSLDDLLATIQDYLKYSVRTGHTQFFNQLWSGFTVPGLLGDLFTSLANTSDIRNKKHKAAGAENYFRQVSAQLRRSRSQVAKKLRVSVYQYGRRRP